ncbi:MAG: hypothetical protein JWM55_817 [Acidimicrobiaceae bacterium]|nr:hypothetical protein [Acidimicrobiaceae bacterium]
MKLLTTAVLIGALSMSVSTSMASAGTLKSGTVHVFDYGDGEGVGSTVVLTGVIGDMGSADSIDANGTPDPQKNTEVILSLVRGSFKISVVALDKKINQAFNTFHANSSTCSGFVSASGSAPVVAGSGTGAYAGITGSITLNFSLAVIGAKYASGKHKGQCNESNNSPSIGQAELVTGSGTVSF